jgi:hypothetical protein
MLDFTEHSLINLKKRTEELIEDFDYMYHNDEDTLDFSDHTALQKYAESQLQMLQDQLRFIYYSMNNDKGYENMLNMSGVIKQVNQNGDLTEYHLKSMQVNKQLVKEFGEWKMLTSSNDEEIKIRKEQIEIELFGARVDKPPYIKYILESLELEKALDEDGEYQKLLKEENSILRNKLTIKSKIKRVSDQELKMINRKREISRNLFGYELTSPVVEVIEEEATHDRSYQLLEHGIVNARMWGEAKQTQNENDWPIMVSMCKDFFDNKKKQRDEGS